MFNKVTLIGRTGMDAEIHHGDSTDIARFRLATSNKWKDRDGNTQERTEWHQVVCFGKLADRAKKMVTKGRLVLVDGSITYREYHDSEGNKKWSTDIKAHNFLVLDPKQARQQMADNAPEYDIGVPESDFDDVPF